MRIPSVVVICLLLACSGGDSGDGAASGSGSSGATGATSATTAATTASTSPTSTGASASASATGGDGSTSSAATSSASGTTAADGGGSSTGEQGRDYSDDRDKFFGDARCDGADVWLCDSFEEAAIDTTVWTLNGGGTAEIDATRAARGASSVHVHTEGNGFSFLQETTTFPAPDDTYFGRMFVWIDAVPIAPDWAHWTLVGARGSGDPSEIRVGGQYNPFAGMNLFGVGTDGGPTGDWTNLDDDPPGMPSAVVVQDWVCIEWMHDGTNNETKFWWDADEHPSLATTATDHGGNAVDYVMPQFESVWVGWWLYQTGPNPDHYDVWIDEVAIDGIRIGCIL